MSSSLKRPLEDAHANEPSFKTARTSTRSFPSSTPADHQAGEVAVPQEKEVKPPTSHQKTGAMDIDEKDVGKVDQNGVQDVEVKKEKEAQEENIPEEEPFETRETEEERLTAELAQVKQGSHPKLAAGQKEVELHLEEKKWVVEQMRLHESTQIETRVLVRQKRVDDEYADEINGVKENLVKKVNDLRTKLEENLLKPSRTREKTYEKYSLDGKKITSPTPLTKLEKILPVTRDELREDIASITRNIAASHAEAKAAAAAEAAAAATAAAEAAAKSPQPNMAAPVEAHSDASTPSVADTDAPLAGVGDVEMGEGSSAVVPAAAPASAPASTPAPAPTPTPTPAPAPAPAPALASVPAPVPISAPAPTQTPALPASESVSAPAPIPIPSPAAVVTEASS